MSIEVTCQGCLGGTTITHLPDGGVRVETDRSGHRCEMLNCECCGIGNGSRSPGWLSDFHRDEVLP